MQVRCPNCRSTMESADVSSKEGLLCSACGERFSLISEETRVSTPQPAKMVGHFRLLEVVGQGAFGVVWRAQDTELDRIVAVKTPRNGVVALDKASQFIREAQAAAQLKHSNIVSVHEVGRIDDCLYIVSDFIDGMTLSSWLRANRPTSREAAALCVTIANALQHAHSAGVVHRDVKPSNILMDSSGSPNIADFGLAKRDVADMTMTMDGQVIGTPAYMSPEQATGDHIDARSDIYSMGVILFEILTGEKPFRGNHRMLLHQVIHDEPPNPHRFNANIPRDLETICLKCLEKNPARRYPSAQEFADDLRRFLANEPIRARPVGAAERIRKWAVRRPLVASLSTAVVLAITLGMSGVIWQWRRVVASQQRHALTQVELIRNAEPSGVESAIKGLAEFREWTDPELTKLISDAGIDPLDRFRCHLALIEQDPQHVEFVVDQLLRITRPDVLPLDELALGTDLLAKVEATPKSRLMELAADTTQPDALRFRALFILARTTDSNRQADSVPWDSLAPFAVDQLVTRATLSPSDYRTLVDAFRPVDVILQPALAELLTSEMPNRSEQFTAASIVAEYAQERPEFLCDLLLKIQREPYSVILPHLRPHRELVNARYSNLLAQRPVIDADPLQKAELETHQATAAVTLLHLNEQPSGVWPLFRQSPDMSLRTRLIHLCARLGLAPEKLIQRLDTESDVSVRRAILLTLGEYEELSDVIRNDLRPRLEDLYRRDADAGIHSAVAWLLRSWGEDDRVRAMDREPPFVGPVANRQWYVNTQGATMVVIDHPPVFMMGAADDEPLRTKFDRQHLRQVDRKFAIAATEVTWEQFEKFVANYSATNHSHPVDYGPDRNGPVLAVTWVQAAKYCRWLSEQENIPIDQMCFPEIDEIHAEMEIPDDVMERTGYRLPSEGEWECACRIGTTTRRFFGDSDEFLDRYGWHIGNSLDYAWQVGLRKPNDYGLFDIYGNAWEWCLDRHGSLPTRPAGDPYIDAPKLIGTKNRMLRGGSMNSRADALRSAQRDYFDPLHNRNHNVGFRIVRTLRSETQE